MSLFITTYNSSNIKVGIANYLKVLFSCYKINSLIYGLQKFKFVDKDFEHIFSSIFKNTDMIYDDCENKIHINDSLNDVYSDFSNINNILLKDNDNKIYKLDGWRFYVHPNDNVNITNFGNEWYLRDCNISIDFRYDNIPQNIRENYINIINKFEIVDKINNNVNMFILQNITEEFLGVHIRTWYNNSTFQDNRSSNERYDHYLSVRDSFINNINNSKYNTVLICTDNIPEVQYIVNKIVNKKVLFYVENPECNYIQNDFSELLLLSKSSYLIGSLNSTFTELAWWYSKCSINVIIL